MTRSTALVFGGLLLTAACGGGGGGGGNNGLAFAGTLTVSSALPSGVTTCQATSQVKFTAAGADVHTLSIPGGDCVEFVNNDTAHHQPASVPTAPCPELNGAPSLAAGGTFTAGPFNGPKACQWEDALNPVPAGGGSGY